jgi:hypothetical protein
MRNELCADHAQPATLAAFASLAMCVRYPRKSEWTSACAKQHGEFR